MRIDLHTHSAVSDGTQPPAELVRAAAAAGIDVMALTDHDTLAGVPRAAAEGRRVGVRVLPGLEMSSRLRGASVHLLAYFVDAFYPPLADELARIRDGRQHRTAAIVDRLVAHGLPLTAADVRRAAGSAASIGRPHVADALVELGVVTDRDEAFARWLADGRPGAVPKYEPGTAAAVALVRAAGGVPVIAHPWGRPSADVLTPGTLAALGEHGLVGVEVDHDDHDADTRRRLRALVRELGMVVTGSSDTHGAGKPGYDVGCNTTDPDEYERLLEAARVIARVAGRGGPDAS